MTRKQWHDDAARRRRGDAGPGPRRARPGTAGFRLGKGAGGRGGKLPCREFKPTRLAAALMALAGAARGPAHPLAVDGGNTKAARR